MTTILVVDDQQETLALMHSIIRTHAKMECISATRAQAGIDLAREHMPDLIFMDLLLPGMDGFEATKIIKSDEDLKHIPVIALTAASIADASQKMKEAGCDDILPKPFAIPTMMRLIEKYT